MVNSVTVRAPCSTANVGAGFDIFGLALDAFYDEVTVTKKPKSFGIKIVTDDKIPKNPKNNTAGIVAEYMMHIDQGSFGSPRIEDSGVEIKIKKDVPAGYGMGSSAASAAACAIGINKLFEMKFDKQQLTYFAGMGERASAGVAHYDNVAASIFGNFVVVFGAEEKEVACRRLTPPKDLRLCVAVPKMKTKNQKTKLSRKAIPKKVKFSDAHTNKLNIIGMIFGIQDKSAELFGRGAEDVIVEKARKKMIPGFDKIKELTISAGANNVTISGAGPSVIAFTEAGEKIGRTERRKNIEQAMEDGFKSVKLDCDIIYCKVSSGPKII